MKVLFLTNVPSPYRVDFFNELGKKCELIVLFEKSTSDERDASWKQYNFVNFKGIFLKGKSIDVDSAICFDVVKYLKKNTYDHIVVTNFLMPTGMIAIQYMRWKGIEYWLESDGGFAKNGKGIREVVKKYFIKGAKGYFSTAEEHDKYYLQYGADPHKIFRYPFTSLKRSDLLPIIPSRAEKESLRIKLGILEEKVILSVGRFSYQNGYGKGFDILLRIAETYDDRYGFYIIGDKPTDEFLEFKDSKKLDNVHFVDFKQKEELSLYYRAADVFVLLSRGDVWGLVINEAMAHTLPVVSSNKVIAGLELIYDDENGYVVKLDNEQLIAKKIKYILDNDEIRTYMSNKSKELISHYTIEDMSESHCSILWGVQEMD